MTVPRFWRNLASRYNLLGSQCENCGEFYLPSRPICPVCRRSSKINEFKFSGNGKIVTYTVVYTASDDFDMQTPYVLAIIQLEEGPRVTSQVICDPNEAEIGMDVKPVFRKISQDGERGVIYYGTKFAPA